VSRRSPLRLAALVLVAVAVQAGSPPGERLAVASPDVAAPPATTTTAATATTATATATTATAATTTVAPRSFTVVFTGDFLLHHRVSSMAEGHAAGASGRTYDYRPLLEPIRPWVEAADWAVCHLEVPLSVDGGRLEAYPTFRVPGQIAFDARDIGYDGCSVASNHVLDQGRDGVAETLQTLDAAGLHSTGAARSREEAASQIWLDIGGVRVAHLAYSYWFNGFQLPADAPWTSNLIDEERILADAAAARAAGAQLVMLSLHWGDEYRHSPNQQQEDLGPRLLRSPDVDLIIGHHAHVVQPIDRVGGEWLVYGLGNVLSNSTPTASRDELLVQVTATERPDGTFDTELVAVPVYADPLTQAAVPSNPASARFRPAAAELEASWNRVVDVLRTGTGWAHLELG
jgi:poly-gamma-glutamate synthesis protein (capsule biosynthesis protein)